MISTLSEVGAWLAGWVFSVQTLIILLAYLLLLKPTSMLIRRFLERWNPATLFDDDGSLDRAGAMIGYLERTLIFSFILLGQYAAVGFILALKAAYRFKDTDKHAKAEYFLIGTFFSLILTLLVGVFVVQLLAFLSGVG